MQRDLASLAGTTFDVVVVGAGIYGALAAWDAAARGLTVALVDRGDFGGATSANSMKTLHGGLRSLQSLNVPQMRRFIRERRAMAILAPHLVEPLPFCLPLSWHPTKNALAVRAALAITDAVGRDRNDGIVDEHLRLPRGRIVSRGACLHLNPIVDPRPVRAGAVWVDYQMRQAERLLLSAVRSAAEAGAVVGNYVDVVAPVRRDEAVNALAVRDAVTGADFEIQTRAVLNATGPWAGALAAAWGGGRATPAARLSRAMNLIVPRVTGTHACAGSHNGRVLLAVPWRDVTILGTSHDPHDGDAEAAHGTAAHAEALLRDAQFAFPRAGFGPGMVRLVHRGLLPMVDAGTGGHVRLVKESAIVDHARDGLRGLVSIVSVRYTTARETARDAVDAVCRVLGAATSRPTLTRFTSAGFERVAALLDEAERREVPASTPVQRRRWASAYGSAWPEVARLVEEDPARAAALSPNCPITVAEVVHAMRHEAAQTVSDVLLRRTDAGTAGHPGRAAADAAIAVMAREQAWSAARQQAERQAFDATYPSDIAVRA